ncbi:MAG TPA: CRISPR-associated protein [candidate division Zixibacteria bacterium]|nr:CRISPR-associated protein [candidate division Zixibacteria bacterium]
MSEIKRGTGLLIIEVVNSNPNGDPDRESDPRQRHDERGMISPVSFKRKLRDLVEAKDGPVWQKVANELKLNADENEYDVLESRKAKLKEIRELNEEEFVKKYWDGRLFGNTELEKGRNVPVKTGVAQFGLGVSIAPIEIERLTTTNPPVQEGKSVGMAPLAFRIVQHGVYCMPFFVNPTAAVKSGCTQKDIDLMLALIPYAYPHNPSYIRPQVNIRHAWFVEHKDALGSCNDFEIIDALTPKKKGEKDEPSTTWGDYEVAKDLPKELKDKVSKVIDLMAGK